MNLMIYLKNRRRIENFISRKTPIHRHTFYKYLSVMSIILDPMKLKGFSMVLVIPEKHGS